MTNLEKYRKYESVIDEIANNFCLQFFPGGIPEYLFGTGIDNTKYDNGGFYIKKAKVEKIFYHFEGDFRKPYFNKRPSNKDIIKMKILSVTLSVDKLDKANVQIYVKHAGVSWSYSLGDLQERKVSTEAKSLEKILQDKIEHYKKHYLVGKNQFACAYCNKATDNDKKTIGVIISRQYTNYKKAFDYCSSKCALHDQMAHEG